MIDFVCGGIFFLCFFWFSWPGSWLADKLYGLQIKATTDKDGSSNEILEHRFNAAGLGIGVIFLLLAIIL